MINPNILTVAVLTVIAGFALYGRHFGFFRVIVPIVTIICSTWFLSLIFPYVSGHLMSDLVSLSFKEAICDILAFLVSCYIMRKLLRFVFRILDLLNDAPVIGSFNRMVGFFAGLAEGFIIVWLIFLFILVFLGRENGAAFFEAVDANPVLKWIYNHNLLMTIVNMVAFG